MEATIAVGRRAPTLRKGKREKKGAPQDFNPAPKGAPPPPLVGSVRLASHQLRWKVHRFSGRVQPQEKG